VKELQVTKKSVKSLKDKNKKLREDIKMREEQNNQISKSYNTIRSLYEDMNIKNYNIIVEVNKLKAAKCNKA